MKQTLQDQAADIIRERASDYLARAIITAAKIEDLLDLEQGSALTPDITGSADLEGFLDGFTMTHQPAPAAMAEAERLFATIRQ